MIPTVVFHDWQNFYILTGTAAATLVGLLFVAVSLSASANLGGRSVTNALRTFVNPILLNYFQVLFISCLAIIPLQSSAILGIIVMILGCLNIFLALKICWRILALHRDDTDLSHWIWHVFLPLVAGVLFVCSALGFLSGMPLATWGLSITNLLCLAIGLQSTWMLTIWLLLHREPGGGSNPEKQLDETDSGSFVG